MSSQSFADLGVSKPVVNALQARGIESPFAVQRQVIEDVLDGRDVLVQSPTGSGKTLAFGVPLVDLIEADSRRPSALILAPTRELASQIVDEMEAICNARALSIAAVYGGVGIQAQAKRAARAHILVACPGRLEDLLQRRSFTLDHVSHLVLDEADRMLDMGFKPAVDRIVKKVSGNRQTLFFSATLEGAAGQLANSYTHDPVTHVNKPAPEKTGKVEHRFIHLSHEAKVTSLLHELENSERGRTLVFVRTKHGADRLVKKLSRSPQIRAAAMHGNKSQNQRQRALADFESGKVDTLVATDVAARGIDVADVTHVINYDMPEDQDTFVHRVGRTGRAGADGIGISFVLADQARDMQKIAKSLGLSHEYEQSGAPVSIHSETHSRKPSRSGGRGSGPRGQGGGGQGGGNRKRSNRGGGGNGQHPKQGKGRGNGQGGRRGGDSGGRGQR
ncbi:MAG TPA: DEAD/DEAH box helicase [Solirubrobacterales bacterium]|nr:DEAD/DEAH box helicase [Solirubrobacterales bacterium]